MAPSIQPPAAPSASTQSNMREFGQNLERLAHGVRTSGVGARPVEPAASVKPAEVAEEVRRASDSVTEARTKETGLKALEGLLGQARSLAFASVNERGKLARAEDLEAFAAVVKQARQVDGRPDYLEGIGIGDFKASLGAIQVIDRSLSELSDQRGLLGIFQASKLAQIGNLLRGGVAGVVSSSSVVRDRVVAVNLAASAAVDLGKQPESSLLGDGNAAGQILASMVGRL